MSKQQKMFVSLAITSYLLIILMGQMIGLPFICWLLFNVFNFGEIDQLTVILAIVGLGLVVKFSAEKRTLNFFIIDLGCFFLLLLPIVGRLMFAPIKLFNYAAFILPLSLFVVFYFISLWYSYKHYAVLRAG